MFGGQDFFSGPVNSSTERDLYIKYNMLNCQAFFGSWLSIGKRNRGLEVIEVLVVRLPAEHRLDPVLHLLGGFAFESHLLAGV